MCIMGIGSHFFGLYFVALVTNTRIARLSMPDAMNFLEAPQPNQDKNEALLCTFVENVLSSSLKEIFTLI